MPNIFRANFNRWNQLRGLERLTVRQKFSSHTLVYLDYSIIKKQEYLLPPENTPVETRWGNNPATAKTFYGYVNHYETVTGDRQGVHTRMVVVGTSKVLNTVHPDTWLLTTRSSVAREIAKRYRLRSVIHDHPHVIEQWATGTRTDFQALKALADEAGYRLWIDGSTLYFLDPTKVLRSASTHTARRIRQEDTRQIQVLGGSNIPGLIDPTKRVVQYGLDYRNNEFFTATSGDPDSPVQVVTTPVNTYGEALAVSDAADRKQADQYVLQATVLGDSSLFPGAMVALDSGRVNRDQAGLWLVNETTHEITNNDFITKIVATRGKDMQPLSRIPSPVRGTTDFVPAVVRDGVTWEAALQEHVRV